MATKPGSLIPEGYQDLGSFLAQRGIVLTPEQRAEAERELEDLSRSMGMPPIVGPPSAADANDPLSPLTFLARALSFVQMRPVERRLFRFIQERMFTGPAEQPVINAVHLTRATGEALARLWRLDFDLVAGGLLALKTDRLLCHVDDGTFVVNMDLQQWSPKRLAPPDLALVYGGEPAA